MQTCNFTPNKQIRKPDLCTSNSPNNSTCAISPKLNLLKIEPEQSLSPKTDGKLCSVSGKNDSSKTKTGKSSSKLRFASLLLAAALNGCVPDSALLSETDATAEVSQVDATEESDTSNMDVKKPRRDVSSEEEEDVSDEEVLDATEEDVADVTDAMDADVEDRLDASSEDVSLDETEAPDRVPPRDTSDVNGEDVADVTEEDVVPDRPIPRDIISEDVTEDRTPPRDVPEDIFDAGFDAPEDRVIPPMDVPRDTTPEISVDVPSDTRDSTADATRYCTTLRSFGSYLDLNALPILSCTPNPDGSSNSACPNPPRTFNGLGVFATDTNGPRNAFDVSFYCMEGGRATMRFGGMLLRTSETATFCILTAPDRGVMYSISGIRHLTSPPGRDGLGAIDGQIRAVDSTSSTCRTSVP